MLPSLSGPSTHHLPLVTVLEGQAVSKHEQYQEPCTLAITGEGCPVARCIIGQTMPDDISEHFRLATLELIARYTVGIAVENNRGVGTGTLVLLGGERFILTAAHVVGDSNPKEIRFWMRPPRPIQERAAADTSNSEIGGF